ncbi:hypothetical protein DP939_34890 [Spongiactinospora rosea]|uniref:Amidohydrolase family protein n=1 Tax=Spongiactinospora rosea TaxID=2248750 RepID=A0A366LPV9_9ACTN|nr:hypothetical protein [Spongiactinospora rosea]RBQ15563.1 hypothetical protein DP939_34890 [Spongiactinospora rosea]
MDVEVTGSSDMFTQMWAAYRRAGGRSTVRRGSPRTGLDDRTGSLTVGKQADLPLLRADRPDVAPVHDPAGTVVLQMDRAHMDTVLVAGRTMLRDGRPLALLTEAAKASARPTPLLRNAAVT